MPSTQDYRKLGKDEIGVLLKNGCRCADWSMIFVAPGFSPQKIRNAEFSGTVTLGVFDHENSGISGARIINCRLHDNCLVRAVADEIRDYEIGRGARISGLQALVMQGKDETFANGLGVNVLIESGGREVVIHENLSAQEAYLQAFLPTGSVAALNLRQLVRRRAQELQSARGIVGAGAVIEGCGIIENSNIGEMAIVRGVLKITSSTVNGFAGAGSIIEKSIIASSGKVGEGCVVDNCFIGEAALLDKGFSAEKSLFFANSECLRGEACAVFAGPYTVSHHKSTLLLAGLYSFYNAGSGSNFSNHRYKLGPVHQGVLERGCKNGSGSYLLWPGHIGAFTTVIGKHPRSLDISGFPFSLLLEQNGKSVLLPGANLFTIGLERDLQKWPQRDKRGKTGTDLISFNGFSPYTAGKILQAEKMLKKLSKHYKKLSVQDYPDFSIPEEFINKSLARYHAARNLYYGEVVAASLEQGSEFKSLKGSGGEWYDLCGLLLPDFALNALVEDITHGAMVNVHKLQQRLVQEHQNYNLYEEGWISEKLGLSDKGTSGALIREVLENWVKAAQLRRDMLLRDMAKEYTPQMHISFGLLGDAAGDFAGCRGREQTEPLARQVKEQTAKIEERAEHLLKLVHSK